MTTAFLKLNRHSIASTLLTTVLVVILATSCKKWDPPHNNPEKHSAEVLDKWMTMQLRLMRNSTGISNHGLARHFAYAGVAALESISPGLPAHEKWSHRWNGLTGLPTASHHKKYHYPANVNAAMAAINKAIFPNASDADKNAIDSLEDALNQQFLTRHPQSVITLSSEFGKAVAAAVFTWCETDNYKDASSAYTPPAGAGLWVPTAPAFANAVTPYWSNNRPLITGSGANTQVEAPPAYSTDPNSAFYKMAKKVYDASQTLTDDEKAMALFWRDVPGVSSPGHWLSIIQQVVRQKKSSLETAALAYALTGAAGNDALICCFKTKYQHNLMRPITYIQTTMGQSTWNSFLTTPAHPEYSSAHSALSAAAADVMQKIFGNVGSFTDHTYDYLGYGARTYPSFMAIAEEAGKSRLYAGIHYQVSIDNGLKQGRKVAANIFGSSMAQ